MDPIEIDAPSGAHLRSEPNLQSDPVGALLRNDTRVQVTGRMRGDWVPVKIGDREGFVYKDLLRDTKTGHTLERATESGVICTTGDCAKRHKLTDQKNREALRELKEKLSESKAPANASDKIRRLMAASEARAADPNSRFAVTKAAKIIRKFHLHATPKTLRASMVFPPNLIKYKSKGWCAGAVADAFHKAGIPLRSANANNEYRALAAVGMKRATFDPKHAPPGSVLICNGGGTGNGHIEITVIKNGTRMFCSDFCEVNSTCSHENYYNRQIFKWPGT